MALTPILGQLSIIPPPSDIPASAGNRTSFTVAVSMTSNNNTSDNTNEGLQYQWYLGDPNLGGTVLSNTDIYSNTTTATLNISNTTDLDGNATPTNHIWEEIISTTLRN